MSEHADRPDPDTERDGSSADAEPEAVRTGVAEVDEVIAAVEGLADRPLEEHVGVFETVHEQLRRALDAPVDDPA